MKKMIALMTIVVLLAACTPQVSPAPAPSPLAQSDAAAGSITLTYWHALPGVAGKGQDDLAARFNEAQSDIQVTSEFQGGFYTELGTKLLTAYGAKNAPEVSQLGTYEVRQFATSGVLVDLTPFIKGEDGLNTEDWPQTILAAGEVNDGIYWLPFNIAVPVLYYNAEAFNKAGLKGAPETWEEFYAAARALTERDANGKVTRPGLALWDISWPMQSTIWSEGGELTDKNYQNITLNDPINVEVLSQFQALVKEGAAVIPDKASGGHRAAFKNGLAAMILDSPSPSSEIFSQAVGFTPKVANYPAGKKGKVYSPGAGGLVMLSTTPPQKRAAAWKFLKYMLSPESLGNYARQTGYIAFYPSAQKQVQDVLKDERYAIMYAAVPNVRWDFSINASTPVRDAFEEAWQKIFFELADVKTSLDAANLKAQQGVKSAP